MLRVVVIGLELAAVLSSSSAQAGEPETAPIRSLAALHKIKGWDLHRPRGLSLDGTITYVAPDRGLVVVQDRDAAAALHGAADLARLQVGDHVHVEAATAFPTIPSVPGFPFAPSSSEDIDSLQVRGNNQPHYLDRFRGYVVPPVDGPYRFWISSDDSSELWLSDNESSANARKIAAVPTWTEWDEWTRFPTQRSQPVELQAGRRYYVEVLHEQTDGVQHVSVAWERSDHPREAIGAESMVPYQSVPASGEAPRHGVLHEVWRSSMIGSLADLQPAGDSYASFEVANVAITVLGRRPLPDAVRIKMGEPLAPNDDFRWAEIVAEIRSVKSESGGVSLDLMDGDNRMIAHVQNWSGAWPSGYRGYLVRLSGVCERAYDAQGRAIPGRLWIPHLRELPIAGTSPTWNEVPPRNISELLQLEAASDDEIPVRVRGRIVARTSARSFQLEDDGSFAAYSSGDGRTWKMLGPEVRVPMRDPVTVGLAVTSHGHQATAATFDHVTGIGNRPRVDRIGTSPQPGEAVIQNGTFTLTALGQDIWDWEDEFFFVHNALKGDGEFVARLGSVSMHNRWAKAGLMIRESLAPDAPFVDIVNVGGNRLSLQWRLDRPHRATEAVYTAENESAPWLKLVRRHHAIPFSTLQDTAGAEGELVDVFGYLHRNAAGAAIVNGFIRPVEANERTRPEDDDRPLLEARSLAAWGRVSTPNYFRLRGVVTCNQTSNGEHYFAIQDATGGAFVSLYNAVGHIIQPGAFVDVYCDPIVTGKTTQAVASKVVTLGTATMPKPIQHPTELLENSKGNGQWIEAEGIVYAVREGGAILRAAGSYVAVEATGMGKEDWAGLIDSRIRVHGVALDQHASEVKVLIPGPSYVEKVGYDVAAASPRSIGELSNARNISDPTHRVQVAGTLTFATGRLAIVDDGSGTASVELRDGGERPQAGDRAEVVGFPTVSANGAFTLLYATVRRLGPGTVPPPIQASASDVLAGTLGQRLVTFDAEVFGIATSETGDVFELQSDGRKFRAWCPAHSRTLESIRDGSLIRLTGFAYQGPVYAPTDPVFTGEREREVHFIVRAPEDIVYLRGPPWIGLKRALYVFVALTFVLLVVIVWAQILRRRVRQRTQQLEATLAELREEAELSATLTERQRLAGEIHDSLEQGISGIMLQLEAALQSPSCPAEIRETISVARNMVSFSHAEIRHAIWDLHSPILKGSNLHTALRQLVQLVGTRSPAIDVVLHGSPVAMAPGLEHHLLRIAQEAVTNAVKHARASKIEVELTYSADTVELRIQDDGCGFSTESHLADATHFGLRSLRRRAKKMNARLTLQSAPHGGTVVEVVVPLPRPVAV